MLFADSSCFCSIVLRRLPSLRMRHLWVVAAVGFLGCTPQSVSRPPPTDAFYFPSGLVYVDSTTSSLGMLYVASANFDKRYDSGTVISVPLSGVAELPAISAPLGGFPRQIDNLGSGIAQVAIQSFAGEMDGFRLADGRTRLFIPTRAEGDLLEIVDSQDGALSCLNGGRDCVADSSVSLTSLPFMSGGKPRAPEPVGVAIRDGQVYITHLKPADSPPKTNLQLETYTVNVAAENPIIDETSFLSLGLVAAGFGPSTNSVAVGGRFLYLSSRYLGPGGAMVWLLHRQLRVLYSVALERSYFTLEARGLAINPEETRLYVAGRNPDSLVVVDLTNVDTDTPTLRVVRAVPLPEGPNEVRVISRRNVADVDGSVGRLGDLVVITSSTAGTVSIYDNGVGRLVAQIPNVGVQPFGLAVRIESEAQRDKRARIFVSNFGDGRIGVIDLPDLARPQTAALVAYLGKQQTCLVQDQDASCVGAAP